MNLSNELLSRFKKTWEMFRPASLPHKPARYADHLVKLNLPPLMGRRDAAYDCACTLVSNQQLFAHDEPWRRRHYSAIYSLLRSAGEDTKSILMTLSSPDTASREKSLFSFVLLLQNMVQVLDDFTELSDLFLEENPTLKDFSVRQTEAELSRGEKLLSEAEINTVNSLRFYCERALPKITRYREYTAKSFSKSNASRYQKAYDVYATLFCEELKAR